MILVLWVGGKPLTWDVTAVCLLVTYLDAAASNAGSVADTAAERKTAKLLTLGPSSFFNPLQLNHWAQCTSQHGSFLSTLVARSQIGLVTTTLKILTTKIRL